MSFSDICCSVANHMGFFAGKSRNVLSSAQKKLKESSNLPEKIRNAMFEKLSRTLYKQAEFMLGKVSERMEAIDKVARPFYEKINELSARGPISEPQLWEVMDSIEPAKNLSDEEKALLVTIFGQFAGVQKSKFVDATVIEENISANSKCKPRLNAGTNR